MPIYLEKNRYSIKLNFNYLSNIQILALVCLSLQFFTSSGQTQLIDDKTSEDAVVMTRDSTIRSIEEKLKSAREKGDSTKMAHLYASKGLVYYQDNKHITLQYFFKARTIFEALRDSMNIAYIYRAMGELDILSFKQSVDLLKKSIRIAEQINDTINLSAAYHNLGNAFTRTGIYDSALYYYKQSIDLTQNKNYFTWKAGWYTNTGYVHVKLKNYDEGLYYYKKALSLLQCGAGFENNIYQANILGNLMDLHFHKGNYDSVFYYFDQVKDFFDQRRDIQICTYRQISRLYEKLDQPWLALTYYQKADSIRKIEANKNDGNALERIEFEYQSELKEKQLAQLNADMEKAGYLRFFLLIIIILGLVFSAVIIHLQKQKAKRKIEADKKIMEANLKNSELQKQYLRDKLNYTNKELTSFATKIVENYDILSDFKAKVSEISQEEDVKKIQGKMKELNLLLYQIFHNDINRKEFLKRSRQLNHTLIFYLKTHYKQLSESDINILVLIFLKFSSKEIAILFNIEVKSVEQRRYRIRNKLNMKTSDNFDEFFDKVLAELSISEKVV